MNTVQVHEDVHVPADTVLVVEDSKPMNAVVTTMFKSLGFNVIEFPNGLAAQEFVSKAPKLELLNISLIFSDYMMPGLDGVSLLKFIRGHEILGQVPFIIATAAATTDLVTEAKLHAVSGVFVKPLSHKRLKELIQKCFPDRAMKDE
jgi:two-component system chemotaxis response regulator CheY